MRFSFFSSHSKNDKTLLVSRQFLTNDEKTANNISKMWNIMNLFFGGPPEESLKRQVGEKASGPDVSEKTGSRHNEKYEQDITALREKFGNSFITGLCIRITLKEALGMMPRNRKRVDAYDGLARYLQEEYGIILTIYSQKTKPNDHEEDNL